MRRASLVVVALLIASTSGSGCGLAARPEAEAWVAAASARSHSAEQARDHGDRAAARDLLRQLAVGPVAPGVGPDDSRAVRMDAYFRLATLELEDASPKAARDWAEQGLALGARRDVFTANLHLAHGRALEALGVDLEAQASYHRALVVTEALLGTALDR